MTELNTDTKARAIGMFVTVQATSLLMAVGVISIVLAAQNAGRSLSALTFAISSSILVSALGLLGYSLFRRYIRTWNQIEAKEIAAEKEMNAQKSLTVAMMVAMSGSVARGKIEREDTFMRLVEELTLILDPESDPNVARNVALLHDVGKIGISSSILESSTRLTEDEWETLKSHPVLGQQILRRVEGFEVEMSVIRHTHERWDGKGYPDGLSGDEIPLLARIVLVCDAFTAMAFDSPYRKAFPYEQIRAELERHAGTQFDPKVVAELAKFLDWALPAGFIIVPDEGSESNQQTKAKGLD